VTHSLSECDMSFVSLRRMRYASWYVTMNDLLAAIAIVLYRHAAWCICENIMT